MSFFSNTAKDWERLDWQILRDGGIQLYWRREYLVEETRWLAEHDYDLYEFACETWLSPDAMFSDFGRVLRLPDWWGRNLDSLDECIADLPLSGSRGAAMILANFDTYAAGSGSALMHSDRTEAEVILDIIARASRFHLLNGNRLIALVQTNDPKLRVGTVGGMIPIWNRREWLEANRQPTSQ
jgi:barstar (barnase inhibitor)